MNEFLGRQIVRQPTSAWAQIAMGVVCAALAVAARLALAPVIPPSLTPFILFFPAVTLASVFAGGRGGMACLVGCMVAAALVFPPRPGIDTREARAVAAIIFLVSAGAVVWLTSLLRRALIEVSASREHERLMLGELQHRVKNTLAVVQAVAAQSLQAGVDPISAKRAFTDRLVALAQAHNLLSDSSWTEVSLRETAERTLAPFVEEGSGRLTFEGGPVLLPPDHVVSLALCLHELAVNATKYGALSRPEGRVQVRWRAASPGRVRLEWSEHGGPLVTAPARAGFGSRLLRQGLSNRARPVVELSFGAEGVRWLAEFDVEGAEAPD